MPRFLHTDMSTFYDMEPIGINGTWHLKRADQVILYEALSKCSNKNKTKGDKVWRNCDSPDTVVVRGEIVAVCDGKDQQPIEYIEISYQNRVFTNQQSNLQHTEQVLHYVLGDRGTFCYVYQNYF